VIQLSQLHWRDYAQRPNPAAAALMAKMGMKSEERPRVKLECLRMLTSLGLEAGRNRLLSGFIDTYLRLNAQESLLFEAQVDSLLDQTEKGKVMELTTSWKEEGRQEGRQEGRLEGEVLVVLRQLRRRCGVIPALAESKVRSLSSLDLENLADALLDFSTLADLERWLDDQALIR
jgi:hypothetical protein